MSKAKRYLSHFSPDAVAAVRRVASLRGCEPWEVVADDLRQLSQFSRRSSVRVSII